MSTSVLRVGMREFRTHLQQYLMMSSPVGITRHGETVGYYIPTKSANVDTSDIQALKQAAAKLDELLSAHGVREDDLLMDFRKLKTRDKE